MRMDLRSGLFGEHRGEIREPETIGKFTHEASTFVGIDVVGERLNIFKDDVVEGRNVVTELLTARSHHGRILIKEFRTRRAITEVTTHAILKHDLSTDPMVPSRGSQYAVVKDVGSAHAGASVFVGW